MRNVCLDDSSSFQKRRPTLNPFSSFPILDFLKVGKYRPTTTVYAQKSEEDGEGGMNLLLLRNLGCRDGEEEERGIRDFYGCKKVRRIRGKEGPSLSQFEAGGGGEETRTRRRKIEESKGKGGGGIKSA